MRVHTAVAAGALAVAASFPLAGVALAEGGDCSSVGPQVPVLSEEHSYAAHRHRFESVIVCGAHVKVDGSGFAQWDDRADGGKGSLPKGGYGAEDYDYVVGKDDKDGDYDKGDKHGKGYGDKGYGGKGYGGKGYGDKGYGDKGYGADGDEDSGPAPVGGIETGAGGTAGDGSDLLLPLSLAGGAALAAGGAVLIRRRLADQAG